MRWSNAMLRERQVRSGRGLWSTLGLRKKYSEPQLTLLPMLPMLPMHVEGADIISDCTFCARPPCQLQSNM